MIRAEVLSYPISIFILIRALLTWVCGDDLGYPTGEFS